MLESIYNLYAREANFLKGWEKMSKTQLANLYLDNKGSPTGEAAIAALMWKYQYKVGKLWNEYRDSLSQEECYNIVADGIITAFQYAAWRDPSQNLYGDIDGPDKSINRCIDSARAQHFVDSNAWKRLANHKSNCQSLDSMLEKTEDYSLHLTKEYEECMAYDPTREVDNLIKYYVDKGNLVLPLIIYYISYEDCSGEQDKPFSNSKLVNRIHSTNDVFVDFFTSKYQANREELNKIIQNLNGLSSYKINLLINRSLYEIKEEVSKC